MSNQNEMTDRAIELISKMPMIAQRNHEANSQRIKDTEAYQRLVVGLTGTEIEMLMFLVQLSYSFGVADGVELMHGMMKKVDGEMS
tara:strand:+ start:609 stop:866 length:258 start_codon:yes stop_codon:yes gene_type:complete